MDGENVATARAGYVARDDRVQPLALRYFASPLGVERPVRDLHAPQRLSDSRGLGHGHDP